ncbi:5-oxoprolinase subunit PxpA [Spongiimicrobium salis]|uniref:5-oxoprolinase subunit PxpA n=1 Tax=Spongiimicrobium salis TaxID=1667022 RepID=UPI00374D21E6
MKYIDINCDVGEGIGNETQLLPLISSCNIACGGHAGDRNSMEEVIQLAKEQRVKIGAHPSYPDKENFGRVSMPITKDALLKSLRSQMLDFMEALENQGGLLHHIKPHGALYNDVAKDRVRAQHFLEAIHPYKQNTYLYVPFNSIIADLTIEQGFKIKWEAFGDRNYNADLSLVSRKQPHAMVHDPEEVLWHLVNMANTSKVTVLTGEKIEILADTFCIHGDTPTALEILMYLTERLSLHNIAISK